MKGGDSYSPVCVYRHRNLVREVNLLQIFGAVMQIRASQKQKHAQYSCRGFCLKLFECARYGSASSLFASSFFVQAICIFKVGSSRSPTSLCSKSVPSHGRGLNYASSAPPRQYNVLMNKFTSPTDSRFLMTFFSHEKGKYCGIIHLGARNTFN